LDTKLVIFSCNRSLTCNADVSNVIGRRIENS
jgi:hypothetical protein